MSAPGTGVGKPEPLRILVVGQGAPASEVVPTLRQAHFVVDVAGTGREGIRLAAAMRPDAVVCDMALADLDGWAFCRLVRSGPDREALPCVFLGSSRDGAREKGWNAGVDHFLASPFSEEEVLALVAELFRPNRVAPRSTAGHGALSDMHQLLETSFDQMVHLLMYMLDLSVPGAGRRGRELADAARRLADRFEVPAEFLPDLERAALLHEIGGILHAAAEEGPDGRWGYVVASAAILRQVHQFRGAAELVECIYENWDGTGHPGHKQRGQIPFRSRLLRVLIDYAEVRRGARPGGTNGVPEALQSLARHAGTWYDPLVVGRLVETVHGEAGGDLVDGTKDHLVVTDLRAGMILAEDLLTGSGVKLLGEGATLTEGSLDIILRRHQIDPVLCGAWIARERAAV